MGAVGTVSALLLGAVFTWSAIAKLIHRDSVARDFSAMGIPVPGITVVAVALVEGIVATALVVRPEAGAVAAIALLIAFSAVLAAVIRSGREVRCGCFGANAQEPISVVELARNASLMVFAALAVAADRSVAVDVAAVMVVSLTALLLLVAVNLLALARTSGSLLRIESELP